MSDDTIRIHLKSVRTAAGLSLAQTAEVTGVSKAMLGQIERGESSPTLATLWKIAKGFHLPLTAFIEDTVQTTGSYAPAQPHPKKLGANIGYQTVFPFDPVFGSETFLMTLEPGQSHVSQPHDRGVVEDVFVTTGEMELLHDGAWRVLRAGDGLRFPADQPHGYRNQGDTIAQFHNTIHYPRSAQG
ncbi:helix-turn-helix domain-containing protein [Celeribacter sp. ULVN23_4]